VKIDTAEAILYLDTYINFCLCLPYSLLDLGNIRLNRLAHNAVDHM